MPLPRCRILAPTSKFWALPASPTVQASDGRMVSFHQLGRGARRPSECLTVERFDDRPLSNRPIVRPTVQPLDRRRGRR
jgi:hypothetical protein